MKGKWLVYPSGFWFSGHALEQAENFAQIRDIEVLGPRFEKSRFLFGLFRRAPTHSETTFVNQLSILFHNCGLRVAGRSSEDFPKFPPRNSGFALKSTPGWVGLMDLESAVLWGPNTESDESERSHLTHCII